MELNRVRPVQLDSKPAISVVAIVSAVTSTRNVVIK